ncbi:hypothetical protein H5410_064456 [Solanum commersonii]|uniref:Uncharacterized protein n=1 Tax=Solanum commersonii TaxID=4109 RepID=A0A9J5VZH6_SOLCO|nr:hypothetical protein H5410_064456 [Solanum commersonii]
MRRLTNTLSKWSRLEYGDIFAKAKEYEEQVRGAEETLILIILKKRSKHNINAQYIRYLKAGAVDPQRENTLHWFKEGDANTKYFHALMREEGGDFSFIKSVQMKEIGYKEMTTLLKKRVNTFRTYSRA